MKKLISTLLVCAMVCTLLTGCVYESIESTVHADGSGTLSITAGISEEAMKTMMSAGNEGSSPIVTLPGLPEDGLLGGDTFEIDGIRYYGTKLEQSFASSDEFNELLGGMMRQGLSTLGQGEGRDIIRLARDGGGLTLTVDNRPLTLAEPRELTEDELREQLGWQTEEAEPDYEAGEEELAEREEKLFKLFKERVSGFKDEELREMAEAFVSEYFYDTPETFEEDIAYFREMSKEELKEYIRSTLDHLHWELTDKTRASRETQMKKVLKNAPVKLTGEELDFYAHAIVEYYESYMDREFAELLSLYREMSEEDLRGELDWYDELYGGDKEPASDGDEDAEEALRELEELMNSMTLQFVIRFDSPVTQIAGANDGVTIEGGKLTLDLLRMKQETYRFTTRTGLALAYEHAQPVELDGTPIELSCYALRDANGNETNYVRLRDLADLMSGTDAKFGVAWDGAVNIASKTAYAPDGTEGNVPFSGNRTYSANASATRVDGRDAAIDSILLTDEDGGGYTYYKLRDLGRTMGFNVYWDDARGTVCIESGKPYTG